MATQSTNKTKQTTNKTKATNKPKTPVKGKEKDIKSQTTPKGEYEDTTDIEDITNMGTYEINTIEETMPTRRRRGNPAMYQETTEESKEKTRKKMLILSKLNELDRRRGIAKFDNVEQMQMLIDDYFSDCVELEIRPTIRGLASALGTNYSTLNDWENGSRDRTLDSNCSVVIKKAKQFIAEFDEMLAMEGIDNPILFMFRAKNYYGMKDQQDITITPNNQLQPTMSIEEITKRVQSDVVIDIDDD